MAADTLSLRERIAQALREHRSGASLSPVFTSWEVIEATAAVWPVVEQAIQQEKEKVIGEAEKHFGPIAFREFKRQLDTPSPPAEARKGDK